MHGPARWGRASSWLVASVTFLALAGWTWSRPTDAELSTDQNGELLFTVLRHGGHGRDVAFDPGDAVFLATEHSVDVSMEWVGATGRATNLSAWSEVVSSSGWRHRLDEPREWRLPHGRDPTVTLDFADALRVADEIDDTTGTSGALTAVVVAELRDGERAVGHGRLTFDLSTTHASPAVPFVEGGQGPARVDAAIERVPIPSGRATTTTISRLSMGPVSVERRSARLALTSTAGVITTLAVAIALVEWRARRRSHADDVIVRYGRSVIWVGSITTSSSTLVDVEGVDTLMRVGRDLDLPVTAERRHDAVLLRVIDGETVYRCRANFGRGNTSTTAASTSEATP